MAVRVAQRRPATGAFAMQKDGWDLARAVLDQAQGRSAPSTDLGAMSSKFPVRRSLPVSNDHRQSATSQHEVREAVSDVA